MKGNILITGCGGFIASKIAKSFIDNDEYEKVISIDNFLTGSESSLPKEVICYEGDCSEKTLIQKIFDYHEVDTVLHFAAQSSGEISFDDPEYDLRTNTLSTLHLLDAAVKFKVKKFIFASTMSVYGDKNECVNELSPCEPKSFYGVGKLASERYIKIYKDLFGLNAISLRLFNIYGPGQNLENLRQGMVSIYLAQLLKSNKLDVHGSIERFRDLVYVDDVVSIVRELLKLDLFVDDILNIGTGKKTTVEEMIKKVCVALNKDFENVKIVQPKKTLGDISGIYADNTKLLKIFPNLHFTSFEDGIKKMARRYL